MTLRNTNKGIVKAIQNNRIVIELPRGGTFTFKSDRVFKIGESICFTVDTILQKVTGIMPKKEADDIVRIGEDEAWGAVIGGMDGIDLEDTEIGIEEENDNPKHYIEEDSIDGIDLESTGQDIKGGFDFSCGEDPGTVIDPADYFADPDNLDEPDGAES